MSNNQLLTEYEAAQILDLKPGTLQVWRSTKRYPLPYVKLGRLIRYRRSDLDDFLRGCVNLNEAPLDSNEPTLELALLRIRQYAEEHELSPKDVCDIFTLGLFNKSA